MGFKLKNTKIETHRPVTDVVMCTSWDDAHLSKNVKNRLKTPGATSRTEKSTVLNEIKSKYPTIKTQIDHSYKNPYTRQKPNPSTTKNKNLKNKY